MGTQDLHTVDQLNSLHGSNVTTCYMIMYSISTHVDRVTGELQRDGEIVRKGGGERERERERERE